VQIQGTLLGDANPLDWLATQTQTISGSVSVQGLNGVVNPISGTVGPSPDNPDPFAINQKTVGSFDWLDAPGLGYYQRGGGLVVGAKETFSFTSTLTDKLTGASCSVNWSLSLVVNGKNWTFTRQ
jgi:hypothetical protein